MIYFDNAATTKPDKSVIDIYNKASEKYWYNPSSINSLGIMGSSIVNKMEDEILDALNLKSKKIIFTSGATEANNLAIYGICGNKGGVKGHIITTSIEHPSVFNCYTDLELLGYKVTCLEVDKYGQINLDELKNAICPETILISIIWVNNIIGSIMPIKEIINIVKDHKRIKLHVDAVQGFGKIVPDFDFNDIDLMTISLHKIHGLKGIGLLVYNDRINLKKITKGGHQQKNIRPGTVDVPGIVACRKAITNALSSLKENFDLVTKIYQYTLEELSKMNFLQLNTNPDLDYSNKYSPYIINISLVSMKGETFMHLLENKGIYVGTGSACNAKSKMLERTVLSITKDPVRTINSLRISFNNENTFEEAVEFIKIMKELGKEN